MIKLTKSQNETRTQFITCIQAMLANRSNKGPKVELVSNDFTRFGKDKVRLEAWICLGESPGNTARYKAIKDLEKLGQLVGFTVEDCENPEEGDLVCTKFC